MKLVVETLDEALKTRPQTEALRWVVEGVRHVLTVAQLASRVAATATELAARGVAAGDRVLVRLPPCPEFLIADLAILSLGAVTVGVHPSSDYEMQVALSKTTPKAQIELPLREGRPDKIAWWRQQIAALTPDMPAAVSFTSGTTGEPLAALHSHRNLAFYPHAFAQAMPHHPTDAIATFLQLHRPGSRQDFYLALGMGIPFCLPGRSNGWRGNVSLLQATMLWHHPQFFRQHFSKGRLPEGLASRLGRFWRQPLRAVLTGGAPLPLALEERMQGLGLPLCNLYGMTEATSGIACNLPHAWRAGTVGRPLPGVDVRLDDDGEVLVRSPGVMLGYLDDDARTTETVRDGWLHTGDLGEIDADGFLRLIGRKKNLLVLSFGLNVPVEGLEARLAGLPGAARAIVVGEGRPEPVLLVVPQGRPDLAAMRAFVRTALHDRPPHERIRKIGVMPRDLSEAEGELTAWGKVRRRRVEEQFASLIDDLYTEGETRNPFEERP